jgi:putative addiction module CopG family antidote
MKVTTMNISLPNELARYVREKVDSGLYSSVSEVVREALRRLSSDESSGHSRTLAGERFDRATAEQAVHRILELQKKQTLGTDLSIEDLIREGREL